MLKSESLNLYRALNQMGNMTGVKFAYAVAKNINLLKGEMEAIDKSIAPSEEYQKFEAERVALAEKYAKKDESDNPVKEMAMGGLEQYVMANEKQFKKEFESLKEKHKEAIKAREKQAQDYEKLLATDSTVVLHKVKLADVPETITTQQLNGIYAIIEE